MIKVLVTGGGGFIGRFVLPMLVDAGYDVHAVSRSGRPGEECLTWHNLDLLDSGAVDSLMAKLKPDYLLHLAWYTEHGKFWSATENLDWLQASLGLLKSFVIHGGKRCVLAGSCAEYSWEYGECIEDETPCEPATLYGASKNAFRQVASIYCKQHGISMAWGRIFFLYGPHEAASRFVPQLINGILHGAAVPCSSGEQLRDFLYVEDVASAFATLLGSSFEGNVNIASGKSYRLKDIAEEIASQLGGKELLQFGILPVRPLDPKVLSAAVERLDSIIGWRPRFDLQHGIAASIDWWKSADQV